VCMQMDTLFRALKFAFEKSDKNIVICDKKVRSV
jgi:hypothetical protein